MGGIGQTPISQMRGPKQFLSLLSELGIKAHVQKRDLPESPKEGPSLPYLETFGKPGLALGNPLLAFLYSGNSGPDGQVSEALAVASSAPAGPGPAPAGRAPPPTPPPALSNLFVWSCLCLLSPQPGVPYYLSRSSGAQTSRSSSFPTPRNFYHL